MASIHASNQTAQLKHLAKWSLRFAPTFVRVAPRFGSSSIFFNDDHNHDDDDMKTTSLDIK